MTNTTQNTVHGDPFCAVARTIEQDSRRYQSGVMTTYFASVPILLTGIGVGIVVGTPTGPAAPVTGFAAGAGTTAALTAATYYTHEGIHDWIDRRQNQIPAVAPVDMNCKQHLASAAMRSIKRTEQISESREFRYEGSSLQKILRSNPLVLDTILATPVHSDPMNVRAPKEEKHLRGFAVDNAPRPMTSSEQFWGKYAMPRPAH